MTGKRASKRGIKPVTGPLGAPPQPPQETPKDDFLDRLKRAVREIIEDPGAPRREKNTAIATGAKLLAIEHRIKPQDEGDFFGG